MEASQKDSLLRKIAGLLAKAEATEFEAERQTFLAKADELMMKYSVELWELAQHEQSKIDKRQPVVRDFDYHWAFDSGPFPQISEALWSLFVTVANYATCTIVYHKQHYSGEAKQAKSYTVPVIGTEVDLGYMTLLFTSLMTQLIDAVHPRVDKSKTYEENLRMFREAGWSWPEVGKVIQEAGWDTDLPHKEASDKATRAYRRACKMFGWEQNYANHKTYRRNFADGFASRIYTRLAAVRQETEDKVGTSMALVLRDQKKINMDFMFELFPQSGTGKTRALSKDTRKFDSAAYSGGRVAGDRASISVNPSKGVRGSGGALKK